MLYNKPQASINIRTFFSHFFSSWRTPAETPYSAARSCSGIFRWTASASPGSPCFAHPDGSEPRKRVWSQSQYHQTPSGRAGSALVFQHVGRRHISRIIVIIRDPSKAVSRPDIRLSISLTSLGFNTQVLSHLIHHYSATPGVSLDERRLKNNLRCACGRDLHDSPVLRMNS